MFGKSLVSTRRLKKRKISETIVDRSKKLMKENDSSEDKSGIVNTDEEEFSEVSWDDEDKTAEFSDVSDCAAKPQIWKNEKPPIKSISFAGNSGLMVENPGTNPIDYFYLIFSDEVFNLIIEETNINAENIFHESTGDKSRITHWKDLSREEFEVFLGLLYHMGTIRINRLQSYWRKDNLYDISVFPKNLSRDRFLLILKALHFARITTVADPASEDDLYKICPLITLFRNNMKKIYYPEKELNLDELVYGQGRIFFNKEINSKRYRYNVKLYVLTEANGLILNCVAYAGTKDRDFTGSKFIKSVVNELLSDYGSVGHAVYMSSSYNSLKLSHSLLRKSIYSTGTLNVNCKGNPTELVDKKLQRNEVECVFSQEGVCVLKWRGKSEKLMISSEHGPEVITVRNKKGHLQKKPSLAAQYYKFMGGVVKANQLLSYCPCLNKFSKWYVKLGVHFFQIMLNNAHCLYNRFSGEKLPLYDFREKVILALLHRSSSEKIQPPISEKRIHLPILTEMRRLQRKRCRICIRKGKRKDVSTYCPDCPEKPGLCLGPCFREYHSY